MSTVIISAAELARMRDSTLPPSNMNAKTAARRAELKKLSTDKLKHWPNTLEATRLKKESFIKDREAAMEMERQEVDKQEAELMRTERLAAIRRANNLIYDQTDKMKMLKSQKAYADVIWTRQEQIKGKERKAQAEVELDATFHVKILERVKLGGEEEERKKAKKQKEIEKIKVIRKSQREEVNARAEAIRQADIEEGIRKKADFKRDLREDLAKQERRQKMIIDKNFATLEESKKDQARRDEILALGDLQDAAREAEKGAIEHRKLELKRLEKRRFDRTQETKARMIEAAVRQLEAAKAQGNAVFAKQEQDIKDREDKKEADKEAKRKAEWDAICASRDVILERKEMQYWEKEREEAEMVAKFKKANEDGIQAEKDKQQRAKEAQTECKMRQLAEGKKKRAQMEEDVRTQKEQERFLQSVGANDDKRFKEICIAEIERNVAAGKPVYTLLRALEFVAPSLLAAKTIKKTPEERRAEREAK